MATRAFKVCENILVYPIDGNGEPATHGMISWIKSVPMADQRWVEGFAAITDGQEVMEAIKDAQPGDIVKLREPLWERLKSCVESPRLPPNTILVAHVARALLPFMRAIRDAERVE